MARGLHEPNPVFFSRSNDLALGKSVFEDTL